MEEGLQPAALELSDAARDFVAGAVGGACGVLAGAPLDVVRIRQQQTGLGAGQLLRNLVASEGVRSLWKGTSYPLLTSSVQNAVVFSAFEAACRRLGGSGGAPLSLSQVFAAGCFSGAVQTAVVTPVDLLKIRLQLQTTVPGNAQYRGALQMLRQVLLHDGLAGVYRGVGITALRDVPSHGVYFAVFEAMREELEPGCRTSTGHSHSALAVWAAGGVAGAVSWMSIYPLDVVKSRVQARSASNSPYKGWMDCAMQSYREEGIRVFTRGLWTTLGRAFLVNGAIFSAYEAAHKALPRHPATAT